MLLVARTISLGTLGFLFFTSSTLASPTSPQYVESRHDDSPTGRLPHVSRFSGAVHNIRRIETREATALSSSVVGAYYNSTSKGTYTSITATVTVPPATRPQIFAYISLDNIGCPTGLVAGLEYVVSGAYTLYLSFYSFPGPGTGSAFPGFTYTAGDTVRLTISATSLTTATVQISNLKTGTTASKSYTSPNPFCLQDAAWFVEVPTYGGLGTFTFNNASVTTASGASLGPAGATVVSPSAGSGSITLTKDSVTATIP